MLLSVPLTRCLTSFPIAAARRSSVCRILLLVFGEQATANQFQNQQEFCDIKTRMAANHCETLAAIQANQAAIIGYMTQEKISGLERENAALTMQLSQNAQTRAIIEALSKTSTTTPAA